MPGLFIAFEGLDGSGKSTVLKRVAEELRQTGLLPVVTREPGGTSLGLAIRELLLGQDHRPAARTELLLMCADRAEHVATVISPALDDGEVVLSDRYAASTRAYQGGGLQLPADEIESAIQAATGGLEPDLYVLFDVDPLVGNARRSADPPSINALDQRTLAFKQRVRATYLKLADTESHWIVVDANQPTEAVTSQVMEIVQTRISENALNQ